jgi:23S rRNA (pseudouridine1915-N3)-methyltransferase
MLAAGMREGTSPAFAIGGADGLSDAVKERAQKLVSLSALTLPHGLARVLLAEQLYRAWSILARHPYHRE